MISDKPYHHNPQHRQNKDTHPHIQSKMSSPQSIASADGADASRKNLEQITFRFCSECSNMLYPKEDPDAHKLQFTCRTCQYTEEATSTCVFRNVLNNAAGETAGVTQDVGSDPTVGVPISSDSLFPSARMHPSPSSPVPIAGASNNGGHGIFLCLMCGHDFHCRDCLTIMQPTVCKDNARATIPSAPNLASSDSPSSNGSARSLTELLDDEDFFADPNFDFYEEDCRCEYEFMDGMEYGNGDVCQVAQQVHQDHHFVPAQQDINP